MSEATSSSSTVSKSAPAVSKVTPRMVTLTPLTNRSVGPCRTWSSSSSSRRTRVASRVLPFNTASAETKAPVRRASKDRKSSSSSVNRVRSSDVSVMLPVANCSVRVRASASIPLRRASARMRPRRVLTDVASSKEPFQGPSISTISPLRRLSPDSCRSAPSALTGISRTRKLLRLTKSVMAPCTRN